MRNYTVTYVSAEDGRTYNGEVKAANKKEALNVASGFGDNVMSLSHNPKPKKTICRDSCVGDYDNGGFSCPSYVDGRCSMGFKSR